MEKRENAMGKNEARRLNLSESVREPLKDAHRLGEVDPQEGVAVTVQVRRSPGGGPPSLAGAPVSREDFAQSFGASPEDVAAVEAFAADHGLEVLSTSSPARLVRLRGTAAAMCSAFGATLAYYEHNGHRFRGREGALTVPAELAGVVEAVFGLDTRPQVRPHFVAGPDAAALDAAQTTASSFTPPQTAELYGFPPEADGSGQCIGILEFGGGYRQDDLDHYFQSLQIHSPHVVPVSVQGTDNSPGTPYDPEVVLDIEIAGAVAPAARIAVYFASSDDQGFVNAVAAAVHDTDNKPDIISISWGSPEQFWTAQALTALDGLFADARALGITVIAAAGDHGAADQPQTVPQDGTVVANPYYDGRARVDFPASSPNAIGCGGTTLQAVEGTISAETVWNNSNGWATGGGVSDVFDLPSWQAGNGVPASMNADGRIGRGVPDVAANADSTSGYQIYIYGQSAIVGGTSAVAPLWAGLTARLRQLSGGRLRIDNEWLYSLPPGAFRDVDSGDNQIPAAGSQPPTPGYTAGPGWDACTGRGTPAGGGLAEEVRRLLGPSSPHAVPPNEKLKAANPHIR